DGLGVEHDLSGGAVGPGSGGGVHGRLLGGVADLDLVLAHQELDELAQVRAVAARGVGGEVALGGGVGRGRGGKRKARHRTLPASWIGSTKASLPASGPTRTGPAAQLWNHRAITR